MLNRRRTDGPITYVPHKAHVAEQKPGHGGGFSPNKNRCSRMDQGRGFLKRSAIKRLRRAEKANAF